MGHPLVDWSDLLILTTEGTVTCTDVRLLFMADYFKCLISLLDGYQSLSPVYKT